MSCTGKNRFERHHFDGLYLIGNFEGSVPETAQDERIWRYAQFLFPFPDFSEIRSCETSPSQPAGGLKFSEMWFDI
jgi:hypothetical protein